MEDNIKGTDNIGVDTKLLSSAIIELNISRKNVSLYPVEHPIIEKAVTRAYSLLQDIFKSRNEISLGISKNTLIVEQNYLDKNNSVYRDFAHAMNDKKIASITFKDVLSVSDLNGFLVATSLANDELIKRGGISKVLEDENVRGVSIAEIDYEAFHLTEEDEISQAKKKTDDSTTGLWDSFVYNLMGESLDGSEAKKAFGKDDMIKVDAKKLAKMMSESNDDLKVAENKYDEVIADYIREANKKDVSDSERKRLMRDVANLTNELSSDMRRQFLKSTFKSGDKDINSMQDFVADLSSDTILETLEDVNEKRLSIPTTILNLLEKFATVDKDGTPEAGIDDKSAPRTLKKDIEELLFEDHQEDFTPDSYQASLNKFIKFRNVDTISTKFPEAFSSFVESFADEVVDLYYAIALIEIAQMEKDIDEFKKLLEKLSESGRLFVETGQYQNAVTIWKFFRLVYGSNEYSDGFKEAAKSKIDDIKELKITDELITGLKQWGKERYDEIKDILLMFQDMSLKPLLKELSLEENAYYRKLYLNIISEMDREVSHELVKHLDHKRWYFVRNIVLLLRKLKASDYIEKIRECYGHENKIVRVEVLKTLLELHGNVGISILKAAIDDEDDQFSHACILLAGSYKINELTSLLISKLGRKNLFFKSNIKEKNIIINALGDMGDTRTLPVFKDIIKKSSLFSRANLNELKINIFKNLGKFEFDEIKELIDIGLKVGNEEIKNACRQLQ